MKTVKPLIAILLLTLPCLASVHFVSQTLKPTAKLAAGAVKFSAKETSYPVRHPLKTGKGAAKGFTTAVKTIF